MATPENSPPPSSIPADSPLRGVAAFFRQPVDATGLREAQHLIDHINHYNVRCLDMPDIEYRSSDGDIDIRRHVFRWDRAPYDFVFQNGFEARRQANTQDETYYKLERYLNSGGRPIDTRRDTTHVFVSTTLSSSWHPNVIINLGNRDIIYRYEIYAPGGILVAETLGNLYHYPAQDEVAFPAGIGPQYIRSAQLFEFTNDSWGHTRRRRVNNILYANMNFNPRSSSADVLRIQRPVFDYVDEINQRRLLVLQLVGEQQKGSVDTNDELNVYFAEAVTGFDSYIDSAFRSKRKNESYVFFQGEYVLMNYAPVSTNDSTGPSCCPVGFKKKKNKKIDDRIVNGPHYIGNGFCSLADTAFAEYGIDAAFGCHGNAEAVIFSGNLCALINYAPGTTADRIIEGPKTIRQMFPFFKGTNFEKGIDAAFESSVTGEAYLFKGSEYVLINYYRQTQTLIVRQPIADGFECLRNCDLFKSDIGAAFASHVPNEAYLFKGNSYLLLHFTPGEKNDYIIGGPKEVVPRNWPSLKDILPCKNRGLDIYEFPKKNPERDHDDL